MKIDLKQVLFFYMYENLKYSFKNKGVLEASEDLAKLMEQVKEVRLQKNWGKHGFLHDLKKNCSNHQGRYKFE